MFCFDLSVLLLLAWFLDVLNIAMNLGLFNMRGASVHEYIFKDEMGFSALIYNGIVSSCLLALMVHVP